MIAVFKTNVAKTSVAKGITNQLQEIFPSAIVNFDLKDCDRILRVEMNAADFEIENVIELVNQRGHHCEVLND